jgi:hypothetical protein
MAQMAQHETREVATYLRNGSLWVGHFVVSSGELDFGDDRFDAAHGLASFVYASPASSPRESGPRVHAGSAAARPAGGRETATASRLDAGGERLKLAA